MPHVIDLGHRWLCPIQKKSSGNAEGFSRVSVILGAVQPVKQDTEESWTEAEISRDTSKGMCQDLAHLTSQEYFLCLKERRSPYVFFFFFDCPSRYRDLVNY